MTDGARTHAQLDATRARAEGIARVAVFLPVDRGFDYLVPAALGGRVRPGVRVWVPWGGRSIEGVVTALDPPDAQAGSLKPIARLVDAPPVHPDLVSLAAFIADYYLAAPGEVLRLCLPAGGRATARRTVRLTDAGRAAAAQLGAALEPHELRQLGARERELLRGLRESEQSGQGAARSGERAAQGGATEPRGLPPDGTGKGEAQALRALLERGWVTLEEQVRTRRGREAVRFCVARAAGPDEPAFARSPARAALYARIAAAGEIGLDELRSGEPRARQLASALVEAGLLRETRGPARHDPFAGAPPQAEPPPTLTAAQAAALAELEPALARGEYAPFLLHGVTGSGKTEVYLRAIATALASGKRALVLVPEISLTPQLAARFRGRFGGDVAVLHSALSDAARAEAFGRIQRGEVAIALGARSAVFAPLDRLGIVIVDEEHDPSFKQQEGVRYHGRDVALVRAKSAGAVIVLGSATPSAESWHAAREGRYRLLSLPERATARPLPEVDVLDLKVHHTGEGGFLTARLLTALEETLAAGEQAILFLNRRGFSTFLLCKSCGQALRCRDCSVTLTWHKHDDRVVCHYCGFHDSPPRFCPGCQAKTIVRLGYGTEQVEAAVRERFPAARVARLDRDAAKGAGLERVLDGLRAGTIDVVVGTQMVTKGHDFPNVTLVGVVLADQGMGLPDYRASERTFQLLEQVAGRAGRGEKPGRVLIQTYNPRHPAVRSTQAHDYGAFIEAELADRRAAPVPFPPFVRLACVHVDGADPQAVRTVAAEVAQAARAVAARAPGELEAHVAEPTEAPLSRLKGRTRWQVFVRARTPRALRAVLRRGLEVAAPRGVRLSADVDPVSML